MTRTQLIISYRGTRYVGWQRQQNGLAIQQVVEEAIDQMVGETVKVVAAGRTDAGVHALGQSVHLDSEQQIPVKGWVHGTNRFLPEDIRVLAAHPRQSDFHARFGALEKEYQYRVSTRAVVSALENWRSVQVPSNTNFETMNKASQFLIGRHDFSAFALAGGSHHDPHRRIRTAGWRLDERQAVFSIIGEGFLRGMVRSIVGTLLEVGRGDRDPDSFRVLLQGRPRDEAGATAPAKGLVLQRVVYSDSTRENSNPGGG